MIIDFRESASRSPTTRSTISPSLKRISVGTEVTLYFPVALVAGIDAMLIVIVVFLATVSEMAGVIAVQIGTQRRYDGPMGKSDRAFVFAIIGLGLGLNWIAPDWINILLIVVSLLLIVTIINRCRHALEQVT